MIKNNELMQFDFDLIRAIAINDIIEYIEFEYDANDNIIIDDLNESQIDQIIDAIAYEYIMIAFA